MSKKIYIISQSYSENKGSFSGVIEEFAKYTSLRGYKVIILCGKIKNQPKFEKLPYAEVHRFSTAKALTFRNVFEAFSLSKKIKKYFRKNPPSPDDLIITNGEASLGVINKKFLLRAGDQPAFTFLRNMELAKEEVSIVSRIARAIHLTLQFFMELFYVKKASAIIFSSEESRNLFVKHYKVESKPYFIPRSGVKIKNLKKGKRLPLGSGRKLLFISLYRERIRKGVMYLEKVLPEIFKKYDDLKLIHIGEKFPWNVPDWCKERIISVGRVPWSEMKDYYATADILVNCSLNEGFPNTLLEAMAAETPIVTSDINGIQEYLTHLKEGYIYRRGDPEALKRGISYMLDHPKEREKMAKAAKQKVKPLDYENYSEKLLKFLEEIITKKNNVKSVNLLRQL